MDVSHPCGFNMTHRESDSPESGTDPPSKSRSVLRSALAGGPVRPGPGYPSLKGGRLRIQAPSTRATSAPFHKGLEQKPFRVQSGTAFVLCNRHGHIRILAPCRPAPQEPITKKFVVSHDDHRNESRDDQRHITSIGRIGINLLILVRQKYNWVHIPSISIGLAVIDKDHNGLTRLHQKSEAMPLCSQSP